MFVAIYVLNHNAFLNLRRAFENFLRKGIHCLGSLEQMLIEDILLKLTTKSQIETRLTEQKYSDSNSRSFNVQQHL